MQRFTKIVLGATCMIAGILSQNLPVQNALCKESLSDSSKNALQAMVSLFRVCFDRVT